MFYSLKPTNKPTKTTSAKIPTKSKSTQITTQQERFQPKSQTRSSPVAGTLSPV
jgi:hypothetical protein